jgi:hypothetical protein
MIQRAAIALVAFGVAGLATAVRAEPKVFLSRLTGAESVALNSTPLETRIGTGTGMVIYDPETTNFDFMISFEGLIAEDITTGEPGTTPAPARRTARSRCLSSIGT